MSETLAPRLATDADEAAIVACVRAAYAPYLLRMDREPAPMTDDYAARIAAGRVQVLDGGDGIDAVLVFWPEGGDLFLENIAVAPAAQGQGIGRRLLLWLEDEARARGLEAITLYTNAVMTENLAFYARLGFVETDRRRDAGYDRVFVRKPVAPL
jgi:ribosomal protein S18 acetylase RimI-like enzyme